MGVARHHDDLVLPRRHAMPGAGDAGTGTGVLEPDLAVKLRHTATDAVSVSLRVGYCASPLKRLANTAPLCRR
jgi:hypothetical protein